MKPFVKVKFTVDGEPTNWGFTSDTPGEITVNLRRDEMGGIRVDDVIVSPDPEYRNAVQVVLDMAAKYHQKLTELQTFGQALTIDLHYLHKWLPE